MLLPEPQLLFQQAQSLAYYYSSAALAWSGNRVYIPVLTAAEDKHIRADSAETTAHTREMTVSVAFGGTNDREAADRIDVAAEKYCNTAEDINSRRRVTEVGIRRLAVPGNENRTDTGSGTGMAVRSILAVETTADVQLTIVVDRN